MRSDSRGNPCDEALHGIAWMRWERLWQMDVSNRGLVLKWQGVVPAREILLRRFAHQRQFIGRCLTHAPLISIFTDLSDLTIQTNPHY